MCRILSFILFIFYSIVFSQTIAFPQLVVNDGEVNLTFQSVEINVVGNTADVHLYQSFLMKTQTEANFSYPVQVDASLYELTVYTDESIFSLDARNMNNIRKQVAAENRKGKNISTQFQENVSILELNLPKVQAGKEIKIALKYMQNLTIEDDLKLFEVPTFINNLHYNHDVEYELKVNIISPTPIQETSASLSSSQEKIVSDKYRIITYKGNGWQTPIQIRYRTKGEQVEAGMLVYEESGCRYILGVVEPPEVITPEEIAPREYIFVMDISGSMNGFPLETSKKLVTKILNDLKEYEKFNILFFAGSSDFFAQESVYATQENVVKAIEMIAQKKSVGNTKLSDAMRKIYSFPPDKSFNRIVVLVTDGKLSEDKSMYFELKQNLNYAQYFCFGIGYDVERKTLQQVANIAGTEAVLINESSEAIAEMEKFFNLIRTPLLRNIQVQSRNLNLSETYPSNFNGFLSSSSTSFISKECSGMREPKLILTGVDGDENYLEEFTLPKFDENKLLNVLKYQWAKEKIKFLLNEEERCGQRCIQDGRYRNQIIRIGEELNISTPFTSFIEESYNNNDGTKGRKHSLYTNPNNSITFQNDFDSDFDKVPNAIDECPYDKGTPNRKGCPKTKQENIASEVNRILEGIEFDFDSYEIKPEFYEKLDLASSIILADETQTYIVEGHTDAAGTPEYNLNLSIQRAKAVAKYLQKKGVKKSQMKVVGKGDTELKHPECRPQEICSDQKNFENRRVIFNYVE